MTGRQYPRFSLHDIDDVEELCFGAAWGYRQKKNMRLQPVDMDSLVAFLVEAVWRMNERYDPARSSSFEAIVRGRLGNRCVDWLRWYRGRTRWQFSGHTHEREIPREISLDLLENDGSRSPGEVRGFVRRFGDPVGGSLGSVDGDPSAGAGADPLGGLLRERDGEAPWDIAVVRALADRLLRERDRAA